MVTEGKKATKELADSFMKHIDAKLHGRIADEIPVRQEQTLKAILSVDRRLLCRDVEIGHRWFWECELWWFFLGTGSIRHDELVESEFRRYLETRWLASVNREAGPNPTSLLRKGQFPGRSRQEDVWAHVHVTQ